MPSYYHWSTFANKIQGGPHQWQMGLISRVITLCYLSIKTIYRGFKTPFIYNCIIIVRGPPCETSLNSTTVNFNNSNLQNLHITVSCKDFGVRVFWLPFHMAQLYTSKLQLRPTTFRSTGSSTSWPPNHLPRVTLLP